VEQNPMHHIVRELKVWLNLSSPPSLSLPISIEDDALPSRQDWVRNGNLDLLPLGWVAQPSQLGAR
jgi:hypothetical protein